MYWFCYFEHYEKSHYNHHIVVQADNDVLASLKAHQILKDDLQLEPKRYMLELYAIDGEYFIFD